MLKIRPRPRTKFMNNKYWQSWSKVTAEDIDTLGVNQGANSRPAG